MPNPLARRFLTPVARREERREGGSEGGREGGRERER
jgi:hypothetical protein